jgi:RnfABCDGE-type electron transport complex G subunit
MKQGENSFLSIVMVPTLICAVAGFALSSAYLLTRDEIKSQQDRERLQALRVIFPDAPKDGFEAVSVSESSYAVGGTYYKVYDGPHGEPSRKLLGYALEASGPGYSSTIQVTVGVDPRVEIIRGIKITFQQETPGLGANCEAVKAQGTLWDVLQGRKGSSGTSQPWFQLQFHEKRADSFTKVGNKYPNVDGVTGATITTNAVVDAVLGAIRDFKEKVTTGSVPGE